MHWMDITEHSSMDGDDDPVECLECLSWGVFISSDSEVVKIVRERLGSEYRDIQVFPKGCVRRIVVLEPRDTLSWNWCWNLTGEGDDTTQADG